MKRISTCLFILFVLFSCKKDDPQIDPNSLLTVTVSSDYTSFHHYTDLWIFVSDKTGNVLASDHNGTGEIKFTSTTQGDSLSMTIVGNVDPNFTSGPADGPYGSYLQINTYGGLRRGSSFSLKAPAPATSQLSTSRIVVCLTNSPTPFVYASNDYESVQMGSFGFSGPFYQTLSYQKDATSLVLSTYSSSKQPVYASVPQPAAGDTVTIDYSAFEHFAEIITLPPGVSSSLAGNHAADPSVPGQLLDYGGVGNILGYLNGYVSYTMEAYLDFSVGGDVYSTNYSKRGSVNNSPAVPSFTVSQKIQNFTDANVFLSLPYTYKHADYFSSNSDGSQVINWNLNSPGGPAPKITEIPVEILASYPMLDITKLTPQGRTYTRYADGRSYVDFVSDDLSGNVRSTYEVYQYNVF